MLRSCCCGCATLETGCKIIAILGLIFETILFLVACIQRDAASGIGSVLGIVAAGLLLWGTEKKTDTPVLAYLVIQALSTLVKLVAVIVLVAGGAALLSVSEEGVAEKQWDQSELETHGARNINIVNNNVYVAGAVSVTGTALIVFGVFLAIDLAIDIYLWIVVYSFYRQLKGGVDSPPAYKI